MEEEGLQTKRSITPRLEGEPTHLPSRASVLAISLPGFPDVITLHTLTCVCGISLGEVSAPRYTPPPDIVRLQLTNTNIQVAQF